MRCWFYDQSVPARVIPGHGTTTRRPRAIRAFYYWHWLKTLGRWMRYSHLADWGSGSEPRMTEIEDCQYCRMMETGSGDIMTARINIPTRKRRMMRNWSRVGSGRRRAFGIYISYVQVWELMLYLYTCFYLFACILLSIILGARSSRPRSRTSYIATCT